ncbi:MAG: hypothetical protein FJZ15_04055 [Candidatus Omnitrophica bacterium]|nr:hypothetical protein [Candidatus Omnitrophota bacterium]
MKKILLLGLVLMLSVSLAYAQEDDNVDSMELQGTIVDNISAAAHVSDMPKFIRTYSKAKALEENNARSGYSIFSEGKLMRFDEASSESIAEFLQDPESKLEVEVEAQKVDYTNELTMITIMNLE